MSVIRMFSSDVTESFPDLDARQFGTGLWNEGMISFDEAKAFMGSGFLPSAISSALESLPDDDTGQPTPRKQATLLLVGALSYQRSNPLVDQLAATPGVGWDKSTTDAKWRSWSML